MADDFTERQLEVLNELAIVRANYMAAETPGDKRDAIQRMRKLFIKYADERVPLEAFLVPSGRNPHKRGELMSPRKPIIQEIRRTFRVVRYDLVGYSFIGGSVLGWLTALLT